MERPARLGTVRGVFVGRGQFGRVATFAVACLMLAGCSLFSQVPTSLEDPPGKAARRAAQHRPLKPTVKWRNCGKRFDCATVRVPVDHNRPRGKKIGIALIRLPAPKHAKRLGSLVVNPGGPGGSGVEFVRYAAVETVPAEVRARFDVVGFDPRGVGQSAGIDCGSAPAEFLSRDFVADAPGDVDAVLSSARAVASACADRNATLLPHMSTADVSRDVDMIRRALGDRQLTYLGFSYGGTIGLTYAEQFPQNIRAMVLDGPVDPAVDGLQRAHDQAGVLERTLTTFFKVCPKDDDCSGFTGKLSLQRFDALLQRMESNPIPAYRLPGGRSLHAAEALVAAATLLKDRSMGWPYLAAGIAMAEAGDGSLLLSVAESTMYERQGRKQWLAPLLAVNCLDFPVLDAGDYPAAVRGLTAKSRHFGSLMLLLHSPCSYWDVPAQRTPANVTAKQAPPIVVIGTTGDPTTPYHWAEAVAKDLRSGRLLTRDGDGHTAFGKRNVCTNRAVATYLVDLMQPPPGVSCG